MAIRNLAFLRNVPKFGQRLVEAFDDVQSMLNNVSQQTNSSLQGQQQAPPSTPILSPLWLAAAWPMCSLPIAARSTRARIITS